MRRFCYCILFLFVSVQSLSAQETVIREDVVQEAPYFPDDVEEETSRFTKELLNMLFALGLLIGVMLLVTWFLKRLMRGRVVKFNDSSGIKVLESRSISTKSVLHVVEYRGRSYLLGESQNGLEKITETQTFQEVMQSKE